LTDPTGRVDGFDDVFAAGDVTAFPVKQGGIAAQQADAAAESIAELAGADLQPKPFSPVLRGLVFSGDASSYFRAEPAGGKGYTESVSGEPLWWPPARLVGRRLAPYLATMDVESVCSGSLSSSA
jgi:sulfide:quinone oxidoreductase